VTLVRFLLRAFYFLPGGLFSAIAWKQGEAGATEKALRGLVRFFCIRGTAGSYHHNVQLLKNGEGTRRGLSV
jgi:hypothetical protein